MMFISSPQLYNKYGELRKVIHRHAHLAARMYIENPEKVT